MANCLSYFCTKALHAEHMSSGKKPWYKFNAERSVAITLNLTGVMCVEPINLIKSGNVRSTFFFTLSQPVLSTSLLSRKASTPRNLG